MNVVSFDRTRRIAESRRELEEVSRALVCSYMTVELAVQREDWDTVYEISDVALALSKKMVKIRRSLLALGVRKPLI